jgi:GNAT superfamily N-acetyltransferase
MYRRGLTINGEPSAPGRPATGQGASGHPGHGHERERLAASRTLVQMGTPTVLTELTTRQFLGDLEISLAIYADAMDADPALLPGRRDLMRRHAGFPAFRALEVTDDATAKVIGFAYGFHGRRGQWWYDTVWNALVRALGAAQTADWLSDCMEVAEVHVQKRYQRSGIGTQMLTTLTGGRPERTAVLSTPDRDTTARRLYRRLGFAELLTGYSFPGGSPPYVVMGAQLPLNDPRFPLPRPLSASPSIS